MPLLVLTWDYKKLQQQLAQVTYFYTYTQATIATLWGEVTKYSMKSHGRDLQEMDRTLPVKTYTAWLEVT